MYKDHLSPAGAHLGRSRALHRMCPGLARGPAGVGAVYRRLHFLLSHRAGVGRTEQVVDPISGQETCVPEEPITQPLHTVYRYRPRTEGLFARLPGRGGRSDQPQTVSARRGGGPDAGGDGTLDADRRLPLQARNTPSLGVFPHPARMHLSL